MISNQNRYFLHVLKKYFYVLILAVSCANIRPPPGGPVDKTPPEIVQTIPEAGTTKVNPEIQIEVQFSEGINPKTAVSSVFITPYPGEDVKIQSRGRKITIQFPQALKSQQTYVVTFGTGIKDYRGNALATSYTLAFSTGETLDEGEIPGRVFGYKDATGVDVWAYAMSDSILPNPSVKEPDYIVQCNAQGVFQFSYLSPGRYRLFSVRDRLADRLYQRGEDEIGITSEDAYLTLDILEAGPYNFRMTKEDTLRPVLIRAASRHQNWVTLQFSEPIVPPSQNPETFFSCTASSDSLDTLRIQYGYHDSHDDRLYQFITQNQESEKTYRVQVSALKDTAGNPIAVDGFMAEFQGLAVKDTTAPNILQVDPQQKQSSVSLDASFHLIFDEPVDSIQFQNAIQWTDTLGRPVEYRFQWKNMAEVRLVSQKKLSSQTVYRVAIDSSGIADLSGDVSGDTTFTFKTINADTLSEISGTVLDSDSLVQGPFFLKIKQIENTSIQYETTIAVPGPYHIPQILPGNYFLQCYRDEDANGSYSFGKVDPFQHSERFYVYPDTISVRSRWPNEGNDFIMP